MSALSPKEFVAKWSKIQQKETAVSHSHFNDICALIGHKPPLEYDPGGENFSFETQTVKPDGVKGFADVFFQDHFIWEYKGPHADLTKAYQQLQLYREDLQNPPLLITSDIHTVIIHTNFNNYPTQKHTITFDDILSGDGVQKLRWAFYEVDHFVRGCIQPSTFFVEPAFAYVKQKRSQAGRLSPLAQAIKALKRSFELGYEPEWQLLFGTAENAISFLNEHFEQQCELILGSIWSSVNGE